MADVFRHPTALVESDDIGDGTRIWANVHIMPDVSIGPECNICDGCFIESGARIGRGVTIKIGVAICAGVTIEDGVFLGPHVVFTNDLRPRSPRLAPSRRRYADTQWLRPTRVETGATISANATVACGLTVGAWAFVGGGAMVMRDVAPFTFIVGNPGRPMGHVCVCAAAITFEGGMARCAACGRRYGLENGRVQPVEPIQLWADDVGAR